MRKIIYKPIIIKSRDKIDRYVSAGFSINEGVYNRQLKELFLIEQKKFIGQDKKLIYLSPEFKKYCKAKADKFNFICYPWLKTVIKCVNKEDYYALITNRNQDLITSDEQGKLRKYKVAIFGMSVGSNISFVLTQAGISESIIIADFDLLDTTNLNRILAGVHQVGMNKAVIAAHRIYEDNPYAKVNCLVEGIDLVTLEKLLKTKSIDCIVEEIDHMELKIDIRRLAIKYKVPVLMITDNGDMGVLHIERYDLGYKKIFEQDLNYWNKRMSKYSGKKDFADIVINQIVGGPDKVDPRMLKSALKVIEKKLVSWPQLGSAALLGGIAVTVAIKQIVRKESKKLFVRKYLRAIPLDENEY